MSNAHKSITQEFKDHFRESRRSHYEYMDVLRKSQALLWKIDAMAAPILYLELLWCGFIRVPLELAFDLLRFYVGKSGRLAKMEESERRSEIAAAGEMFWFAVTHFSEWAWFWLGMLFRRFSDELGIAMWSAATLILTLVGYFVGLALLVGFIYFLIFE